MSGVESERLDSLSPDTKKLWHNPRSLHTIQGSNAILKQVMDFSKELEDRPEILLRITTLLLTYYDIPDKNYQTLLAKIGGDDTH